MPVDGPLWLIGAGNMGGAMLTGWLAGGIDPRSITVIRPSGAAVAAGVTVLTARPPDGAVPAAVVLAVKPQMLDEVVPALAPLLAPQSLLISVLAGVELASLRARFPTPRAIVRAMPNTPVALGKGVVALHGIAPCDEARTSVETLLQPLGLLEWIDDESRFDLVTALAGSGPAFLFRFIDALAHAGASLGLSDDRAARLALATVAGAAALAAASDETPAVLADRVASPGGSTREGLDVLDAEGALDALVGRTIAAAARRNAELAAAAH